MPAVDRECKAGKNALALWTSCAGLGPFLERIVSESLTRHTSSFVLAQNIVDPIGWTPMLKVSLKSVALPLQDLRTTRPCTERVAEDMDSRMQTLRARSEIIRIRTIKGANPSPVENLGSLPKRNWNKDGANETRWASSLSFTPKILGLRPVWTARVLGRIWPRTATFDPSRCSPNTAPRFRICERARTNP
jgi:hypothetical protein